jgi:hypothetical protein
MWFVREVRVGEEGGDPWEVGSWDRNGVWCIESLHLTEEAALARAERLREYGYRGPYDIVDRVERELDRSSSEERVFSRTPRGGS